MCCSSEIRLFKKGTVDPHAIGAGDFKITDSRYGSLWTFYKCKSCDFVFFNPYIPESGIVAFYSQLEDREYSSESEGRSKNFTTILERVKRVQAMDKKDRHDTETGTLLDIGAASGIFLHLARQNGFDVSGIEPSQFLVAEAGKRYSLDLFCGTLDDYIQAGNSKRFSVVTLLDILEHLVEPEAFLSRVSQLLDTDGILVIVTPDIGSLAARMMGKRWWHYRIAHINFFNRKSLHYLLTKHGFTVRLQKKYVWNFSLYYLLTRIFPGFKHKITLQKLLKRLHLKLPLFDSWEIYAKRTGQKTEI